MAMEQTDLQHVHRLQAEAQSQRTVRREEWEVGTNLSLFPSTGLCAASAKQSVLWIAVFSMQGARTPIGNCCWTS